ASASSAHFISNVLQRGPNSPIVEEGCTDTAGCSDTRSYRSIADFSRATPPICSSVSFRQGQVASHISRLASRDAAKSLLSTLVSASSGECRINAPSARPYPRPSEPSAPAGQAPALAADVPSPHPLTCPPNQCAVRFQHRCRWRMLLNWL